MTSNSSKSLTDTENVVDARGHRCPVPTLKLRRAMSGSEGRFVVLLADDPMAQIDVPHFCAQNGYVLEAADVVDAYWRFRVRAPAAV